MAKQKTLEQLLAEQEALKAEIAKAKLRAKRQESILKTLADAGLYSLDEKALAQVINLIKQRAPAADEVVLLSHSPTKIDVGGANDAH